MIAFATGSLGVLEKIIKNLQNSKQRKQIAELTMKS